MMNRALACLFLCVAALLVTSCSQMSSAVGSASGPVVLDIGHFFGAPGACTPGAVSNGQRISECPFWYEYVYYTRQVIERAGYKCIVTNRGNAPREEPYISFARRARVVHLRKPDRNGQRYPSYYHKDRVASGIVSADYAIHRKAACAVFLHHNSGSHSWTSGASPSLIIHNRYNGRPLAQALARTLNDRILDNGMPNGGRKCSIQPRYVDADRAAGWMNACDDSGIPAAVIEVAFLNNRNHAEFLAKPANARRYAEAIGHGIVSYLRSSGSQRRHVRSNPNVGDEGSFGYAAESRRIKVPGAKLLHQ